MRKRLPPLPPHAPDEVLPWVALDRGDTVACRACQKALHHVAWPLANGAGHLCTQCVTPWIDRATRAPVEDDATDERVPGQLEIGDGMSDRSCA